MKRIYGTPIGHEIKAFDNILGGLLVKRQVTWLRQAKASIVMRHRGKHVKLIEQLGDGDGPFLSCLEGIVSKVKAIAASYDIGSGDALTIDIDVWIVDTAAFDLLDGHYEQAEGIEPRWSENVNAIYSTSSMIWIVDLRAWMKKQREARQ